MRGGRAVLVACATMLCLPLLARAAGREDAGPLLFVALDYRAVPDCPDASEFKGIVSGRLGYVPFRESAPERVLVQIAARAPAFEGRIEWRDAEGRWAGDRTFPSRSNDCRGLARAMAFALALQIQLSARAGAPPVADVPPAEDTEAADVAVPPPSPPAITSPSNEEPAVPPSTEAAKAPARHPRAVLAIGAGASVGFGVSSSPVPFGRLFGNLAWPHWSLELAAEVGWPSTVRREDGAGFSQQVLLLGIAGCASIAPGSACLLAKAGAIHIEGQDIDDPASPSGPLVQTGLRLAVMQPLGRRFYLTAQAEGLLVVTRWQVTLDRNLVWTSPRFVGNIGFDIGVRFP